MSKIENMLLRQLFYALKTQLKYGRIYYGWDHYIADAKAFNRSFPSLEAIYPYAIKKTAKVNKCIEQGALGDLSSVLMAANWRWRSNTVISSNDL